MAGVASRETDAAEAALVKYQKAEKAEQEARGNLAMAVKEAEPIGAREPEILEALQVLWQRLLAREGRGR